MDRLEMGRASRSRTMRLAWPPWPRRLRTVGARRPNGGIGTGRLDLRPASAGMAGIGARRLDLGPAGPRPRSVWGGSVWGGPVWPRPVGLRPVGLRPVGGGLGRRARRASRMRTPSLRTGGTYRSRLRTIGLRQNNIWYNNQRQRDKKQRLVHVAPHSPIRMMSCYHFVRETGKPDASHLKVFRCSLPGRSSTNPNERPETGGPEMTGIL